MNSKDINYNLLHTIFKKVNSYSGPRSYIGVSWKNLERYNLYEEIGSNFVLKEEDKNLTQIYAGLTILSREIYYYLSNNPRDDADYFVDVINTVSEDEREIHGPKAFPYDDPNFPFKHEIMRFPKGLDKIIIDAALGHPKVDLLGNSTIRHEWTVKPGKKLFIKYIENLGPKFKDAICGEEGIFEKYIVEGSDELDIGKEVFKILVSYLGVANETIWYPIGIYLAILLVKRGLKQYCKE